MVKEQDSSKGDYVDMALDWWEIAAGANDASESAERAHYKDWKGRFDFGFRRVQANVEKPKVNVEDKDRKINTLDLLDSKGRIQKTFIIEDLHSIKVWQHDYEDKKFFFPSD